MEFVVVLFAMVAMVVLLRNVIKVRPEVFCVAAIAMDALLLVGFCDYLSSIWWRPLIVLVQRCTVALSLFTVVMLIGVLPKGSNLDMCLSQIRAELSIVACILCMGHMCMYITPYSSRVFAGSLADSMPASFIVALVLFILLVVLGVASFNFVKQRMGGATWKKVQLLAYPFFGLAWVPSCSCSLLPPCAGEGRPSSAWPYTRPSSSPTSPCASSAAGKT